MLAGIEVIPRVGNLGISKFSYFVDIQCRDLADLSLALFIQC